MGLRAILADGVDVPLDPRYGATIDDLHAHLTADALTGSAVPLVDVRLALADGREIPYSSVNRFAVDEEF